MQQGAASLGCMYLLRCFACNLCFPCFETEKPDGDHKCMPRFRCMHPEIFSVLVWTYDCLTVFAYVLMLMWCAEADVLMHRLCFSFCLAFLSCSPGLFDTEEASRPGREGCQAQKIQFYFAGEAKRIQNRPEYLVTGKHLFIPFFVSAFEWMAAKVRSSMSIDPSVHWHTAVEEFDEGLQKTSWCCEPVHFWFSSWWLCIPQQEVSQWIPPCCLQNVQLRFHCETDLLPRKLCQVA